MYVYHGPTKRLHELARPKSQIYEWASGSPNTHAGPSKSLNNLTRTKSRTSPVFGSKSQGIMTAKPAGSSTKIASPKISEIWSLSQSKSQPAVFDAPSPRLNELARPKPVSPEYLDNHLYAKHYYDDCVWSPKAQPSQVWTMRVRGSKSQPTMYAEHSHSYKRPNELAHPKRIPHQYHGDKHLYDQHYHYGCGGPGSSLR